FRKRLLEDGLGDDQLAHRVHQVVQLRPPDVQDVAARLEYRIGIVGAAPLRAPVALAPVIPAPLGRLRLLLFRRGRFLLRWRAFQRQLAIVLHPAEYVGDLLARAPGAPLQVPAEVARRWIEIAR